MSPRWSKSGVTPIIATIFLVGLTITAGGVLWAFSPRLPPEPGSLEYAAVTGPGEQTWGDGSDCKDVNGVQTCLTLPSIDIYFTGTQPSTILISSLTFYFLCNGTVYLNAAFPAMAWVPGSPGSPGAGAPQLGTCGTYTPPKAAFDRLVYFDQLNPGVQTLHEGDHIVLYSHSFEWPDCPTGKMTPCDDDFHGAPLWCFSVVAACSIILVYNGPSPGIVMSLPLFGLA